MRVGITGTQIGGTLKQRVKLDRLLGLLLPTDLSHGDCLGVDEQANTIAEALLDCTIHVHPPDNDSKRAFCFEKSNNKSRYVVYTPKPYLVRNRAIVAQSDVLIVVPKEFDEQLRSGTWATYRYGKQAKIRVIIIYPDGTHKEDTRE